MSIDENFIEWACSFSGCDGGNPNSNIWFAGIEWGGGDIDYYSKDLPKEVRQGKCELYSTKYDWKNSISNNYGRGVAKLFCAYRNNDVKKYKDEILKFNGSEIFKLNLYPVAFRNTDVELWKLYKLEDLTGFKEKNIFRMWCLFHRFPFFSELTKEHNPQLIICTGISYYTDFLVYFGGKEALNKKIEYGEIKPNSSSNNKYIRQYYWVQLNNITTIFIIPFFSGRYGLNSNYLIEEMGKQIRRIIS